MQSLFTRRRVESRWNGDEGFRVRLEGNYRRDDVRGGCGWVCAELKHNDELAEEAGSDGFEECRIEDIE